MSQPYENPAHEFGLQVEDEVREPRLYRVLLHNDDYTTMEFVVLVLVDIFHKSPEEASEIMLSVHEKGIGVCGVYPREIAEFRTSLVSKRARQSGFPLLCTMEEE
jgi:ATP-dependent Clp protease adaptor protein ClpS